MLEIIMRTGFLIYPLSFLYFLVMTIIIERTLFYIKIKKQLKAIIKQFSEEIDNHSLRVSQGTTNNATGATCGIDKQSLRADKEGKASLLINKLQYKLYFGLNVLGFIIKIAPMIGLFGTTIGITKAFFTISKTTEPISPNILADSLWEAILTTSIGIGIAIFAMIVLYIFKNVANWLINSVYLALNNHIINT